MSEPKTVAEILDKAIDKAMEDPALRQKIFARLKQAVENGELVERHRKEPKP
jgi:hypothetical protein